MAGQKTMFSLRNKRRLVKKSENLNNYGPFFIIFPLPVMLKFTVHITAVHLFTCVAKAVTSRRSRESKPYYIQFKTMVLEAKVSLLKIHRMLNRVITCETYPKMEHLHAKPKT